MEGLALVLEQRKREWQPTVLVVLAFPTMRRWAADTGLQWSASERKRGKDPVRGREIWERSMWEKYKVPSLIFMIPNLSILRSQIKAI